MLRPVIGVAVIHLLLALVAFAKDALFAAYFGTSPQADALSIAFFIPDTIGNNLVGTAIGVAAVPAFAALYSRGLGERLAVSVKRLTVHVILAMCIISFLFSVFGSHFLFLVAPGLNKDDVELAYRLYLILIPTMLLFTLTLEGCAILQAVERFKTAAFSAVVFNAVFLVGIALASAFRLPLIKGSYMVAGSIAVGAAIMAVFIIYHLWRHPELRNLWTHAREKSLVSLLRVEFELKHIYRSFILYFLVLLSTQLVLAGERYYASLLESGTVAGLTYAYRLAQFPIWVFIAAITMVYLPNMAKARASGDMEGLQQSLKKALLMSIIITVPMAVFFYLGRVPLIRLLFVRGSFDTASLQVTADIFAGYAIGIVGQAMSAVGLRFFLASGKMGVPTATYFISALCNLLLDRLWVGRWGAAGIGWGSAWAWGLNAVLLIFFMIMEVKKNNNNQGDSHEPIFDRHPVV